jgi:4a-hydroxytetrahydrobiopterin dehydratase
MAEPLQKLTVKDIEQKLKKLEEWDYDDHIEKLITEFEFKTFALALEFVNKLGKLAEEMQHHPDIYIHDYRFVTVLTSTHNVDGVTELDFQLIKRITEIQ